jgi:hypothetical protein
MRSTISAACGVTYGNSFMKRWYIFQGQCIVLAILFLLSVSVVPAEANQSNEALFQVLGSAGTGSVIKITEIGPDSVSGSAAISGTEPYTDNNVHMDIRMSAFDPGMHPVVHAEYTLKNGMSPIADPEVQAVLDNLTRAGYDYSAASDHRYEVIVAAEGLPVFTRSQKESLGNAGFTLNPDGSIVRLVDASIFTVTNTTTQENNCLMISQSLDPAGNPVGEKQVSLSPGDAGESQVQEGTAAGTLAAGKVTVDTKTIILQWAKIVLITILLIAVIAVIYYGNQEANAFMQLGMSLTRQALNIKANLAPAAVSDMMFSRDEKVTGGWAGKGLENLNALRITGIIMGIGLVVLLADEIYTLAIYMGWYDPDTDTDTLWSAQYAFDERDNGKTVDLVLHDRMVIALFADTTVDKDAQWMLSGAEGFAVRDQQSITSANGTVQSWWVESTEPGTRPLTFRYKTDKPIPATVIGPDYAVVLSIASQSWKIETLDRGPSSAGIGEHSSLAIDRNGIPRVSYYDEKHHQIVYAWQTGNTWTLEKVADSDGTYTTSLALDAAGNPSISFGDGTHYGNLMYATRTGTSWEVSRVDTGSAGDTGQYSSLAIDAAGSPHIVYNDGQTIASLKYATWNGTAWTARTIDGDGFLGDTGYDPSLVLDSSGNPHIAYTNGKHFTDLMYAASNGSSWTLTRIDTGGGRTTSTGIEPSVSLDSHGFPHISYYDSSNADLRYASWNGTGWELETVDSINDVGRQSSLAIDAHDQPFISYYDVTLQELKYATFDAMTAKWVIRTVDNNGDVGKYSSLALDPKGHPAISYCDNTHHALKYAGWKV